MSDLHLSLRPKLRLRLRLKPAHCLQRVGPETILDERKERTREKETEGQIVGVTPTPKETGYLKT